MNLLPANIAEQQAKIARLSVQIETLRQELAYERYLFRRKLIRHIFFMLRLEAEVDMEIAFPSQSTETTDACSICLDPLCSSPIREMKCGHSFHQRCIDRWVQNQATCPMCRDPIELSTSCSTILLQLFRLLTDEIVGP